MSSPKRSSLSGERGAAAVEFALVVPLLLTLVLGVTNFGRFFNLQLDLSNAAQEAARYAVFAPAVPAHPSAAQVADIAVAASSAGLVASRVVVSGSCAIPGSSVTVTASKDLDMNLVFGSAIHETSGKAVMRCPG